MPVKKNHTNNPAGRPKGIPNKISGQLRETLKTAVTGELESLTSLLSECDPSARLELVIKLLPYLMPKAHSTETEPQTTSTDTAVLIASTLQRLQSAQISPEQARAEFAGIETMIKLAEQQEILSKLTELELKLDGLK